MLFYNNINANANHNIEAAIGSFASRDFDIFCAASARIRRLRKSPANQGLRLGNFASRDFVIFSAMFLRGFVVFDSGLQRACGYGDMFLEDGHRDVAAIGSFASQDFDIWLRSFCADSSSPQNFRKISGLLNKCGYSLLVL